MRDETSAAAVETIEAIETIDGAELAPTTKISAETWADIRVAYLGGATAGDIRRRWGVPESTVYKQARAGGWTKKRAGDAAARARAEDSFARDAACNASIASHFHDEDGALDEDAADMGARALLASATAMQLGDVTRARALVAMAEGYYRIVPRQRSRLLWYMAEIISQEGAADELFDGISDDTHPAKLRYRQWKEERDASARATHGEIARLKRKLKQVEQELETERAAHMANAAKLFAAWEREPPEEGEGAEIGNK